MNLLGATGDVKGLHWQKKFEKIESEAIKKASCLRPLRSTFQLLVVQPLTSFSSESTVLIMAIGHRHDSSPQASWKNITETYPVDDAPGKSSLTPNLS